MSKLTMQRWVKIGDACVTKGTPAAANDDRDWEKARKDPFWEPLEEEAHPCSHLGLGF